jgi:Asp-tRNA(Asn)/Glu-tRNA(Gln) amidotransferase C subunit
MEIDLDSMRSTARLAGFDWSDVELEALRPILERTLALLAQLEALRLGDIEPATQYRMV